MSSAPREATWKTRSRSCDGHDRWLGQRMSTSPSLAGASGVPHEGQCVGMTNARSRARALLDDRAEDLGDDVAGLAQEDQVADEHALADDLLLVVQRGHRHGRAGDLHRLPSRRTA